MSAKNLIKWIDSHYPAAPTVDNGNGTLTISIECVNVNTSAVFIERQVIPATMAAAREVLGY
ncbi:hypothetical protein [Herbaspirillum sp. YR522]|uniref:hypothetical protein n=1 Tax=Herbaspirillum sp. YR522 TaxID=1144342 RepID=UPI00026FA299|nr:hypothetical protein [Herbaspirillum sp. YR522]EJN06459.1 hypothetical protein PMI40_02245 [Herbaspirillum sp. YR522]